MAIDKALVTGGAGFIGSHLVEELVNRGYEVTVVDNLETGKRENAGYTARFIHSDICDLALMREVCKGKRYVFHLAALPSAARSIQFPLPTHKSNATGTLSVLIAAHEASVERVIYTSSSSIYGDTPSLPKSEDMPPNPLTPYAVSKLAGEYYCRVFNRAYALPTVCFRLFNVYGSRQNINSQYAAVIPRFIRQVAQKESLWIYGDGEQTRDFTYVKDAVSAMLLGIEQKLAGIYNVGTGQRVTINKLASLITDGATPQYAGERAGDIRHSLADISKLAAVGYKSQWALEQGLKETKEWILREVKS